MSFSFKKNYHNINHNINSKIYFKVKINKKAIFQQTLENKETNKN